MIQRAQVMSEMVAPFEVRGRLTGERYKVHFSHLWVGMTTRHADTIDCKFLVNGHTAIVGLAHLGFVDFRERAGRSMSDKEAATIAATYLKEFLADDRELPSQPVVVSRQDVLRIAHQLGLVTAW